MPREFLYDSKIMQNPELLQLYLWCLLKADSDEWEMIIGEKKVIVHRGEFIISRKSGAAEIGIIPKTFRKNLKKLVRMGRIEKTQAHGYTRIRVVDFDCFLVGAEEEADGGES